MLFVAPMNLSTKTSIIFTVFEGIEGCRDCEIMIVSNLCQGSAAFTFTKSYMTSLAVSDPSQDKGGNSYHHICNIIGTTSSASSSDIGQTLAAGRTYQKFHAWICETTRCQRPSVMSILLNSKGKSR